MMRKSECSIKMQRKSFPDRGNSMDKGVESGMTLVGWRSQKPSGLKFRGKGKEENRRVGSRKRSYCMKA